AQRLQRLVVVLGLAGVGGFGLDALVDGAALLGDLRQVAHAGTGDQDGGARFLEGGVDLGVPVAVGGRKEKGVRATFRPRVPVSLCVRVRKVALTPFSFL